MLRGMKSLMQHWVVGPVVDLLRMGATPERLAWSLAVGVVIGVNPLLGSTTVLALALAGVFRLNLVASQLSNHLMYPLELILFPVFVRVGSALFATEKLPVTGKELWHAARHHPWDTTKALWVWEWHALVVWAVFAAIVAPAVALGLRPLLARLCREQEAAKSVGCAAD